MMQRKLAAVARGLKQLDRAGLERVKDYTDEFLKTGDTYNRDQY